MALAVWLLEGVSAALAVIALLVMFSVSRGFCSVAMKDVQGKTVPKTRRGRLAGLAATVSGLVASAVGLFLFGGSHDPDMRFYSILLLAAGLCWFVAAAVFAGVEEFSGETGGGGNTLREAIRSLGLLVRDVPFRNFVIARAFLMASALARRSWSPWPNNAARARRCRAASWSLPAWPVPSVPACGGSWPMYPAAG